MVSGSKKLVGASPVVDRNSSHLGLPETAQAMLSTGKPIPEEQDKQHDRHTYEAVKERIQNPGKDGIVGDRLSR
jgi:hypothetical protein